MEARYLTAITISGCGLLLLALLRRARHGGVPATSTGETARSPPPPLSPGKKKVKFSAVAVEPAGDSEEYRRRRRRVRHGKVLPVAGELRRLPENRRALYNGIVRYRSQVEIVTMYGRG